MKITWYNLFFRRIRVRENFQFADILFVHYIASDAWSHLLLRVKCRFGCLKQTLLYYVSKHWIWESLQHTQHIERTFHLKNFQRFLVIKFVFSIFLVSISREHLHQSKEVIGSKFLSSVFQEIITIMSF